MTPLEIIRSDPRESRCRRLEAEHPNCRCEQHSGAPESSPGPLRPYETVVRIIFSEAFWDDTNKVVKPTAFEEASNSGMSVTRVQHTNDAELQQQITDRLHGPKRKFVKLIQTRFGEVASLKVDDKRAFCCYDTPTYTNRAHADICQAYPPETKSIRVEMRHRLQKLFTDYPWVWTGASHEPTST